MSNRTFTPEAATKLKQIINEGISVMVEVETLNSGLNDTIKAIAEELEVKPSVLKKAIKIAHKQRLNEENESNEELNHILATVGKA